jgi:hypothetical protein
VLELGGEEAQQTATKTKSEERERAAERRASKTAGQYWFSERTLRTALLRKPILSSRCPVCHPGKGMPFLVYMRVVLLYQWEQSQQRRWAVGISGPV